jgi:predicted amidophosphoribosyltransferase
MRRVKQFGRTGFRQITSLFLAQNCPVCDRPTAQTFCLDCQRQIYPSVDPQIGQDFNESSLSEPCLLPVCALGLYSGSLKRAILALKYGDRPDVAGPLGAALAQHWLAQPPTALASTVTSASTIAKDGPPPLCAVPIPLHNERYNDRGFNQAELIARAFCQVSKLPLLPHGLIRVQATRPQHALGLADRQQNLEHVFQIGPSLSQRFPEKASRFPRKASRRDASRTPLHRPNQPGVSLPAVLLVDDIYTTGATAQSAATTLRQAGISVAGIVAVAQAQL